MSHFKSQCERCDPCLLEMMLITNQPEEYLTEKLTAFLLTYGVRYLMISEFSNDIVMFLAVQSTGSGSNIIPLIDMFSNWLRSRKGCGVVEFLQQFFCCLTDVRM